MQLTSFIEIRKIILMLFMTCLCIVMLSTGKEVFAEPLTYSPDQWPRHWNVLMNKTDLQNRLSGRSNYQYENEAPARSPAWGVVPVTRKKPRRSFRPEYNTNSHIQNYYGQNQYQGQHFPRFYNYGFSGSYVAPLMSPYGVSALAPGLAAPGIPFGAYPYGMTTPFMGGIPAVGGMPGLGYPW